MNRLGPLKAVHRRAVVTRKAVAKRFSSHDNQSSPGAEPTNQEAEETEPSPFHTAPVTEARIEAAQRSAAREETPALQARIEKAQREADELVDAGGR